MEFHGAVPQGKPHPQSGQFQTSSHQGLPLEPLLPHSQNHGPPGPILNQPVSQGGIPGNWAAAIESPPLNCPPGLEYLSMVDQLLVHQQIEMMEVITGFETENKYWIRNSLCQDVYYAEEESDACGRNCCGPIRAFEMKIYDSFKNEVIHINRPFACQSCCCPCCLQRMEVFAPPGTLLGSIEQQWSIFFPTFAVKDANEETVLRIEGPYCTCGCSDIDFRVTTADGKSDLGKITKQWSGWMREAYTDADNFNVTFPIDLDVKWKALLLGGLFLIDMMFFEGTAKRR